MPLGSHDGSDPDRRAGERRLGQRRADDRGDDRRLAERRGASGLAAAMLFAALAGLAAPDTASAQIFTRVRNGVVEATNVPASRDYKLTYPGKGTLIHSRGFRGLTPSENAIYNQHIEAAGAMHGVSIALIRAIIQVESQFDAMARSSKGAQGLMQLMPDTARRFGVGDAYDPRQNIFGGVHYLRVLLDMFQGDVTLAAAAYNSGENNVLKYKGVPPFKETQGYVERVNSILNGGVPWGGRAAVQQAASFITPNPGLLNGTSTLSATASGGKVTAALRTSRSAAAARPRTYFKWQDAGGVLHITHAPPSDGVVYSTIRALD
jgi:hypothetical protein